MHPCKHGKSIVSHTIVKLVYVQFRIVYKQFKSSRGIFKIQRLVVTEKGVCGTASRSHQ